VVTLVVRKSTGASSDKSHDVVAADNDEEDGDRREPIYCRAGAVVERFGRCRAASAENENNGRVIREHLTTSDGAYSALRMPA